MYWLVSLPWLDGSDDRTWQLLQNKVGPGEGRRSAGRRGGASAHPAGRPPAGYL